MRRRRRAAVLAAEKAADELAGLRTALESALEVILQDQHDGLATVGARLTGLGEKVDGLRDGLDAALRAAAAGPAAPAPSEVIPATGTGSPVIKPARTRRTAREAAKDGET